MSPDMSMIPAPSTPTIAGQAAHSRAGDQEALPSVSVARIRCSLSPAIQPRYP